MPSIIPLEFFGQSATPAEAVFPKAAHRRLSLYRHRHGFAGRRSDDADAALIPGFEPRATAMHIP